MQYYVANQKVWDAATGNLRYTQGQTIDQNEYNSLLPQEQYHFSIKNTVPLLLDKKLLIPISPDNLPEGSLYSDEGTLKIVLPS